MENSCGLCVLSPGSAAITAAIRRSDLMYKMQIALKMYTEEYTCNYGLHVKNQEQHSGPRVRHCVISELQMSEWKRMSCPRHDGECKQSEWKQVPGQVRIRAELQEKQHIVGERSGFGDYLSVFYTDVNICSLLERLVLLLRVCLKTVALH